MTSIKKIALIGPESTGKTTLCMQLAEYFKTSWVPEYARGYVENLNRKYTLEDIIHCAEEQLKIENVETQNLASLQKPNQFLFSDTEWITAKVWCEDVFKTVPEPIEKMIHENRYELFLLTFPDLPFAKDPVRENEHRREFFFDWYKKELEEYMFAYRIIKGTGEARLQQAISAVEKYFRLRK